MSSKIAVFPAAGGLGTSTYANLVRFIPPKDVLLVSRDPSKIPSSLRDAGVTTRQADYDAPSTLGHAFDGAWCLNLISYPSIEHEHRFQAHKHAIDVARASGVSHIVYSSLGFAGEMNSSKAHVMQAHLSTENYLRELARESEGTFAYTIVREGIYSETWPMYAGFFDLQGSSREVLIPHDGSSPGVAWVRREELGEGTARVIQDVVTSPKESKFINQTILLSGSKEWSLLETAKALGEVSRKPVTIRQVSVEEYLGLPQVQKNLKSHGPGDVPRQWITVYDAIRDGETALVRPLLAQLLGREPESFDVTVRANANN